MTINGNHAHTPCPIKLYSIPQLAKNPALLHDLVSVINKAYLRHKVFESKPRFDYDMQMVEQSGSNAICALMYSNDTIVATATFRPWRPEKAGPVDEALKVDRPDDYPLLEAGLSFEIKAVATIDSPETRGKGLAGQCIGALQDHIFSVRPEASKQGLLLWVTLAENQNGPYWRRRGFELVGESELKPKGVWGAYEEFWYSNLCKKVEGL